MTDDRHNPQEVDAFVQDEIDSVPHLEALLLIWRTRPKTWSSHEMARALYVGDDVAEKILHGLTQRELISSDAESNPRYHYESEPENKDKLMQKLDETYRRELVRISAMIHSKASPAVREFARAFRFKKDKE
jgi:hypothetical protein